MIYQSFSKKYSGFTLLTLLVSMVIAAILTLGVITSYHSFVTRHQVNAITSRLVSALQFARSEAIALGGHVVFCPSAGKRNVCGNDWRQGQAIVFKKSDVLRFFQKLPPQYNLQWKSRLGLNEKIEWNGEGFTNGEQGSFWLYVNKGNEKKQLKQIVVLQTGLVRVK